MSQKVLVDSNIFLDYFFDRKSGYLPIGEFAAQFIKRTLRCDFQIFTCIEVIGELSHIFGIPEYKIINDKFSLLISRKKLSLINPRTKQKEKARIISKKKKVPFTDALLAVVASEMEIPIVTRDKHFFDFLDELAEPILPESL